MTKCRRNPLIASYPLKQRTNWIVLELLQNSRDACTVARKEWATLHVCLAGWLWCLSVQLLWSGFHAQMFLVSELFTVLTKAEGRPLKQQPKHMLRDNVSVHISCALKCLPYRFVSFWQIQVKTSNPQFPVTTREMQKRHSVLKEDPGSKGQECYERWDLVVSWWHRSAFFEYTIYQHAPLHFYPFPPTHTRTYTFKYFALSDMDYCTSPSSLAFILYSCFNLFIPWFQHHFSINPLILNSSMRPVNAKQTLQKTKHRIPPPLFSYTHCHSKLLSAICPICIFITQRVESNKKCDCATFYCPELK